MCHVLFSDDSFLFCKSEPRKCDEVMNAVKFYGETSGQCINFEKLSLLFGKRIACDVKQEIKSTLDIDK